MLYKTPNLTKKVFGPLRDLIVDEIHKNTKIPIRNIIVENVTEKHGIVLKKRFEHLCKLKVNEWCTSEANRLDREILLKDEKKRITCSTYSLKRHSYTSLELINTFRKFESFSRLARSNLFSSIHGDMTHAFVFIQVTKSQSLSRGFKDITTRIGIFSLLIDYEAVREQPRPQLAPRDHPLVPLVMIFTRTIGSMQHQEEEDVSRNGNTNESGGGSGDGGNEEEEEVEE
jgi:hypothetical protein